MTAIEPSTPEPGPDASIDDLRADIEATRSELGHTVEALSAKLDVKEQAKQKVTDTRDLIATKAQLVQARGSDLGTQAIDLATDEHGTIRPVVPAIAAVIVVIVGVVIWKGRP